MKATSITLTTNTIIGLITQPLSAIIKETGSQIHNSLVHGEINTATETIRKLVIRLEELIWES
jgi:hypothetical protein